jgi:hypothetical protein
MSIIEKITRWDVHPPENRVTSPMTDRSFLPQSLKGGSFSLPPFGVLDVAFQK